ncbi:MAG: Hcp family type VI secretion system effector [Gemmatimonadales bacterium]
MAFDAFLKIDGVDGESTRKGFEKQMEIQSFSFGASNPSTIGAGGGGGGGGKVSVSSFNVMKKSDAASPLLFLTCCQGDHYKTAVVTLNKSAGKAPIDFIKYEFEEVYVDNIQWSGASGGDDTPMENVSFSFAKVSITYTPQKPDGSKGSPAVGAWDLTLVSA